MHTPERPEEEPAIAETARARSLPLFEVGTDADASHHSSVPASPPGMALPGPQPVAVTPEFARKAARHGAMTDYDYATRSLVLHPWISPRAKTDALLQETVAALLDKQTKQRGKRGKQPQETRGWVVEAAVARHYGLIAGEPGRPDVEPTLAERSLVARIVDAIDIAGDDMDDTPAPARAESARSGRRDSPGE